MAAAERGPTELWDRELAAAKRVAPRGRGGASFPLLDDEPKAL